MMTSMKRGGWLVIVLILVAVAAGACQRQKADAPPTKPEEGAATTEARPAAQSAAQVAPKAAAPLPAAPNAATAGRAADGVKLTAPGAPAAPAAEAGARRVAPEATPGTQTGSAQAVSVDRDIIKTAQLQISAANTDDTVNRVLSLMTEVRGFVLDQRVTEAGGRKTATMVLRVPVDAFEATLKRLREVAVRVDSEGVTGQDVTDQLVDMESRRRNLEATEARIRSFLDRANTVEEALKVSQQLADVQRQIEEIRGRIEFMRHRAAFSTISLEIRSIPPTPTVTLTPTVTPTPTPVPGWNPNDTIKEASTVSLNLMRVLVDGVIWIALVGFPLLLPVLIVLGLARMWRRPREVAAPRAGSVGETGD